MRPQPESWAPTSAVVNVLGVGREVSVRYLTTQDVDAQPADMAVALDTLLRAQPLEPPRVSLQR